MLDKKETIFRTGYDVLTANNIYYAVPKNKYIFLTTLLKSLLQYKKLLKLFLQYTLNLQNDII